MIRLETGQRKKWDKYPISEKRFWSKPSKELKKKDEKVGKLRYKTSLPKFLQKS